MELRHLRYFVTVAEELNFTKAAERLHMAQPPLSTQIKDLENQLGVKLFERSKRHVALTQAGERFLERATRILQDVESARLEAQRFSLGELGELRIGFASSLPYSLMLPKLLFTFQSEHPQVKLQLSELFSNQQLQALADGLLDVGLVRYNGGALPNDVEVEELGRDSLRLVVNVNHPLAAEESVRFSQLKDESFITFPEGVGSGLPALLQKLAQKAKFTPNIVQQAKEATTQIGLVAAGLGVALLPAPLECIQLPRVRYLPIVDKDAYYTLSAAYRKNDDSPLTQGFLKVLRQLHANSGGQA